MRHEEARELIALATGETLSQAQQSRLRAHLESCTACRSYAEAADRTVHGLRSLPVTADARLVRATQMRVRFHASRLRAVQERMWLVAVVCVGVGISAALTAPVLWRLCAWMGELMGVPDPVWEAGFAFFAIAPALVVGVLLLARGTHLGQGRRHWQGEN